MLPAPHNTTNILDTL